MDNHDSIFTYIMLAAFFAVIFWGHYSLTRSCKPEKDKPDCKCSK